VSATLSKDVLYAWDLIKLQSGEVLTLYGNFNGPWYRARLSFYPSVEGTRLIGGKLYKKAKYETGCLISGCKKLLDLPGEQHFLVHKSQIAEIYRPSDAFDGLSRESLDQCRSFIGLLNKSCNVGTDQHGLTGSRALRSALPMSDFDWVIYRRDPADVKTCIDSNRSFTRDLTFAMTHVYRKYSVFGGLGQRGLDALFEDRWKYFRFNGALHISLSFVDPMQRADNFLRPTQIGEYVIVEATVRDSVGCYHSPRIIELNRGEKKYKVLTWLFLYNGAFKNGNIVEVAGRIFKADNEEYILVESPQDYIRNLTTKGGG